MNDNPKKVIVTDTSKTSVKKALKELTNTPLKWAYFGEDVKKEIAFEPYLKSRGQKLEIGEKLQLTSKKLRQKYIDYIGELNLQNSSLKWWAGSVSEKNPFVSKTFLYLCYTKVALELFKTNEKSHNHVFFVENRALRETLFKNISDSTDNQMKKIESKFQIAITSINDWLKMFLIKVWFISESLNRTFLSKFFLRFNRFSRFNLRTENGLFLIHTWIDQRSFDETGSYVESYFKGLLGHLKKKDKEVAIVPYVLGSLPYIKGITLMGNSGENFLLPYAYVGIRDIFSVAFEVAFDIPRRRVYPDFEGLKISALIYFDLKRDWSGIRKTRDLIFYRVVNGWRKKGIKIHSFIHTYENNTWEKVFNLAFSELYPGTKIIGYQHSAVPKMLLNYFFSQNESELIPLPNRIITNGRYPERLFAESGYDPDKIVCGGAIRYSNLLKKIETTRESSQHQANRAKTILVTTSIILNDALELVSKVVKAFGGSVDYDVIIKSHPVMPYSKFSKFLSIDELPKNFKLSNNSIEELLNESDVLIYTTSTTCIEAISLGVPPIHVESDHLIDMDQLDFAPESRISVRSAEEIVKAVGETLSRGIKDFHSKNKNWRKVVEEVFGPVTEETYNLFLIENHRN
ncbi:MAG: hypothetical protein ACW99F_04790 [Candidatus Hodarchaeales archaeon]|jgi:hypothetical protein